MIKPTIYKIDQIIEENERIRTFVFKGNIKAKPGQFILWWHPAQDAKPFSISYSDSARFEITICKVGTFTEEVFQKKVGDQIGFFGPFGTNYNIGDYQNIILIGGGYGVAPMNFLYYYGQKYFPGIKITLIQGARDKETLIKLEELEKNENYLSSTDDGSLGFKGNTLELLKELYEKDDNIDLICCCGPELMQKAILDFCVEKNIDCQISLERYIKCGCGLCGECITSNGFRMCKEGPVINKKLALSIEEFGLYKTEPGGKTTYFIKPKT